MTYPPGGGYDPNSQPQQPMNNPPYQPSGPPGGQPGGYQSLPPTAPGGFNAPNNPYGPPGGGDNRSKLMLVLASIVGLVLVLGIGAVIVVPKWINDSEDQASEEQSSEQSDESDNDDNSGDDNTAGDDTNNDDNGDDTSDDNVGGENEGGWSDFVTMEEIESGTVEDVALQYLIAQKEFDADTMEELVCNNPDSSIEWDLDYYSDGEQYYEFDEYTTTYFSSRDVHGEIQVAYQSLSRGSPLHEDIDSVFIVVKEDYEWKICDRSYL
ncbi:hypothetical protein [Haloglycomyces albus]|uniref:hypothetical protein n=1 Tax=Haloglycomyces albus TaxID=526067 RepID=UPI00046CE877|nr:hypothetical protein [Haloglycomyces albus]